MKILIKSQVSFKSLPPERYAPCKDRHIPIHIRNIEAAKKNHKNNKQKIEKDVLLKKAEQFIRYKKIETAINNHFKLLNVI